MADSGYKVICTGEIAEGFELSQVQQSFGELFHLSPDKAVVFLSSERVIKRDLSHGKAQAYKSKLESIGVVTLVESSEAQESPGFPEGLALEPMEETPEQQAAPAPEASRPSNLQLQNSESSSAADPAELPAQKSKPSPANLTEEPQQATDYPTEEIEEDTLNLAAIGAAAAAALAGAFIWKLIVLVFNYELGLVAWGIGGLVGIAAATLGGRGQTCGIVCGVLALLSIFGGKYMATATFQGDSLELLTEEFQSAEYQQMLDDQREIATIYVDTVTTDSELRVFMVDYQYTDAQQAEDVSYDEVDEFRQFVEPMLKSMAAGDFKMEDWVKATFGEELENLSTYDLMMENLGLIDIVFLFLGVGTAFKLGSGYREE